MLSILTKNIIGCGFIFSSNFQLLTNDSSQFLCHIHELATHSYQPKIFIFCNIKRVVGPFLKHFLQQNELHEPKHNVLTYLQTHILWWLVWIENYLDGDASMSGMGESCCWCPFHTSLASHWQDCHDTSHYQSYAKCTKYLPQHQN